MREFAIFKTVARLPEWYDEYVHNKVINLFERQNKLVACKYLCDRSNEENTRKKFDLEWSKKEVVDVIADYIQKNTPTMAISIDNAIDIIRDKFHGIAENGHTLIHAREDLKVLLSFVPPAVLQNYVSGNLATSTIDLKEKINKAIRETHLLIDTYKTIAAANVDVSLMMSAIYAAAAAMQSNNPTDMLNSLRTLEGLNEINKPY
jgi:hypothetical protein